MKEAARPKTTSPRMPRGRGPDGVGGACEDARPSRRPPASGAWVLTCWLTSAFQFGVELNQVKTFSERGRVGIHAGKTNVGGEQHFCSVLERLERSVGCKERADQPCMWR